MEALRPICFKGLIPTVGYLGALWCRFAYVCRRGFIVLSQKGAVLHCVSTAAPTLSRSSTVSVLPPLQGTLDGYSQLLEDVHRHGCLSAGF